MKGFGDWDKSKKTITKTPNLSKKQIINLALKLHSQGNLSEAAKYYQYCIKEGFSDYRVYSNYGVILRDLGKLKEAIICQNKAIELNPSYKKAYSYLGGILILLGNFKKAEFFTRKSIELDPNNAEENSNLGYILMNLKKLKEAEFFTRKSIELNPEDAKTHFNLSNILRERDNLKGAKLSYYKAIELKPNFPQAHRELSLCLYLLGEKNKSLQSILKANYLDPNNFKNKLLLKFFEKEKNIKNQDQRINGNKKFSLESNPFLDSIPVEKKLVNSLYKIKARNQEIHQGPTYGNTKGSDYKLFENKDSNIKSIRKKLISIAKKCVQSDILISSSFFTIFRSGGGLISHDHLGEIDKIKGLNIAKEKFSLVYYLSVGDQKCDEPGILKLEKPNQDILPSNGLIIIIPADRKHSVFYKGGKDRIIIGVNFYRV